MTGTAELVRDFLARGGEIQKIPPGVSGGVRHRHFYVFRGAEARALRFAEEGRARVDGFLRSDSVGEFHGNAYTMPVDIAISRGIAT